jgi:hypothetical protein
MLAGAGLLLLLDLGIVSATPDLARELLALVVTALVGGFIVWAWMSNTKLEKAAAAKLNK